MIHVYVHDSTGKNRVEIYVAHDCKVKYSRSCLKKTHIGHKNVVSGYIEMSFLLQKKVWSFKTGGLWWQWSPKTGFTVSGYCKGEYMAGCKLEIL